MKEIELKEISLTAEPGKGAGRVLPLRLIASFYCDINARIDLDLGYIDGRLDNAVVCAGDREIVRNLCWEGERHVKITIEELEEG